MTRINTIQNAIKQMNGGEFHKLADDAQKSINWTIFIQLIKQHLRYDYYYKNWYTNQWLLGLQLMFGMPSNKPLHASILNETLPYGHYRTMAFEWIRMFQAIILAFNIKLSTRVLWAHIWMNNEWLSMLI